MARAVTMHVCATSWGNSSVITPRCTFQSLLLIYISPWNSPEASSGITSVWTSALREPLCADPVFDVAFEEWAGQEEEQTTKRQPQVRFFWLQELTILLSEQKMQTTCWLFNPSGTPKKCFPEALNHTLSFSEQNWLSTGSHLGGCVLYTHGFFAHVGPLWPCLGFGTSFRAHSDCWRYQVFPNSSRSVVSTCR